MNFEDQPDTKVGGGVFDGETICFTGKSPKTRPEMTAMAESAGASVSSSVGSSTTILVIADTKSTSSKAVKAREMGVKLMLPEDFLSKVGV
jgi:DNA ligase (NAD+)